jgi:tetratricopeptide (TPR) repeat protein
MKKNLETSLAKAQDLFNNKAYVKAIAAFEKLIQEYPQEIVIYIDGARCALIANALDTCKAISQQGLQKFPHSLELQSFIIAVTRLEGNIQDALLKLVELQRKQGNLPPVLETERYRAYFQLAAYDKALESVNKVLIANPQSIIALRDKIEILIGLKKYEQAQDLCQQLIQNNTINQDIILFYVDVLKKLGNLTTAKDVLRKYKPPLWELHLARCEIIDNNFDSALKIYEDTLQKRKGPWLSYNKAKILEYFDYSKYQIYQDLRNSFFRSHDKSSDHIYLRGMAQLGFGNDALNYMLNLARVYDKHKKDPNYIFDSLRISNFSRGLSLTPSSLNQRLESIDLTIANPPQKNIVIVSGWFRTGTTYTFSLFRSMEKDFTSYYEPLHPFLFGGIKSNSSSNEKLGHKLELGYYHEYQFIDYKSLNIRYLERFEAGSNLLYSFNDSLPLFDYVNFIVEQTKKDKVPLLQFNRISFILDYFKIFYKNAHIISLIRCPRDVFASIVSHYNRVYDVFPFNAPFPALGSLPRPLGPHNDDWEVINTFSGLLNIFDISLTQDFSFYSKVYVINKTAELFAKEFSDVVISYEELAQQGSTLLTNILSAKNLITRETIKNIKFPEPHQQSIGSWTKLADKIDFEAEEKNCDKVLQQIATKFNTYVQSLASLLK